LRSNRLTWWEKLVSACELTIPSMGPLLIVFLILASLDIVVGFALNRQGWTVAGWSLRGFSLLMTTAVSLYAVSPFLAMRLPWRYLKTLACFPLYFVWKIGVSFGGRPREWVRTTRESPADGLS
jgi:hypothetical protein